MFNIFNKTIKTEDITPDQEEMLGGESSTEDPETENNDKKMNQKEFMQHFLNMFLLYTAGSNGAASGGSGGAQGGQGGSGGQGGAGGGVG